MRSNPETTRTPRSIPAPGLRETADIWFDTGRDPVIDWDDAGRRFDLVDPGDPTNRLRLLRSPTEIDDPEAVARALAEGLAACDFPPTEDGASPTQVVKTLQAVGIEIGTQA